MATQMTSRQRLQTVLSRGIPDRVPLVDISFWPETLERWHQEGLPADVTPAEYFDLDCIERFSFNGSLCLPAEVVEESQQWRMRRDANGLLIKEWRDWRISYSPPVRLDCLVKTWDDWRNVKERLQVSTSRIGEQRMQTYEAWRQQDSFVVISPVEPMWFLIEQLTGFEIGLPLLVEHADLAADILNTYTDFILGMCQLCIDEGATQRCHSRRATFLILRNCATRYLAVV